MFCNDLIDLLKLCCTCQFLVRVFCMLKHFCWGLFMRLYHLLHEPSSYEAKLPSVSSISARSLTRPIRRAWSDSAPYIFSLHETAINSVVNNVSPIEGFCLGLHFPAASEARIARQSRRTGRPFPGLSPSGVADGRSVAALGSVRKAKHPKPYQLWRA